MNYQASIDQTQFNFIIKQIMNQTIELECNNQSFSVNYQTLTDSSYSLIINGKTYHLSITQLNDQFEVTVNLNSFNVNLKDDIQILLEEYGYNSNENDHLGEIHAQIPGLLSQYFIKKGDTVKKGDKLFILEAMKMENEICSPLSGIVDQIHISQGTSVEKGSLLITINPGKK